MITPTESDIGGSAITFDRLKEIIADCTGVDEERITPQASLVDDLGFDSLDLVEIVMAAEDAIGCFVEDEALEKIRTVQDAVLAIDAALAPSTTHKDPIPLSGGEDAA